MFLLYVNDIADKISPQTRIKLFADDCLLYRTIDTKQDHKQDIQALEKVQRKRARFVAGKYSCQDSVTSMLNDLNW
jgi:hypothetical protein